MIILLRHAETQGGNGRYIGTTDLRLSPHGEKQAERVGRALAQMGLRAIHSSPLLRAMDTASIIARICDLHVVGLMPEMAEVHLGQWEGRKMASIKREQPDAYEARGRNFEGFRPPNGESFGDVAKRAIQGLERLADEPGPGLVVTHAGVIRVLLCHALGLPLDEIFRFRPQPAHAFLLEPDGKGWRVLQQDVQSHDLARLPSIR